VGSSASNSRAAPAPPSQMTEKHLLSLAFGGNAFETLSSLVPIQDEIWQYLPVMNTASSEIWTYRCHPGLLMLRGFLFYFELQEGCCQRLLLSLTSRKCSPCVG
jgi:hypothetical protein